MEAVRSPARGVAPHDHCGPGRHCSRRRPVVLRKEATRPGSPRSADPRRAGACAPARSAARFDQPLRRRSARGSAGQTAVRRSRLLRRAHRRRQRRQRQRPRRPRADGEDLVRRLPRPCSGLSRRSQPRQADLARSRLEPAPHAFAARRRPVEGAPLGWQARRDLEPDLRSARACQRDEQLAPLRCRADLPALPRRLRGDLRPAPAARRRRALPAARRRPHRLHHPPRRRTAVPRRSRRRRGVCWDARRGSGGGHPGDGELWQGHRGLPADAFLRTVPLRRLGARQLRGAGRERAAGRGALPRQGQLRDLPPRGLPLGREVPQRRPLSADGRRGVHRRERSWRPRRPAAGARRSAEHARQVQRRRRRPPSRGRRQRDGRGLPHSQAALRERASFVHAHGPADDAGASGRLLRPRGISNGVSGRQ